LALTAASPGLGYTGGQGEHVMAQEIAPCVSLDWMRNYLQRIRRTAGAVLDKDLAAQLGATGNNRTQLLRAARELGLVDDKGRLTDDTGLGIAAGSQRAQQAARQIVKRTYPSLVPHLQQPLARDELKLHFYDISRQQRGRPLGASALRQAAALFRFWVEQSGEPVWSASLTAPPRGTRVRSSAPPRGAQCNATHSPAAPPTADSPEHLGEVIGERTPFYHATISVPAGRRLTAAQWEFVRASLDAKIEFLKEQSAE
jgi:hypothetical protein